MSTETEMEAARQEHKAGRLREAEVLYRRVLGASPNHAGALHGLGVVASQVGQHKVAAQLISQAIALDGKVSRYHTDLGCVLAAVRQWDLAIAAYRSALSIEPDFIAFTNLSHALAEKRQGAEALAAIDQAIALRPDVAVVHFNRGNVLTGLGRIDEALEEYRRALELRPDYVEACHNLGGILFSHGDFDEAVKLYRRALELRPEDVLAHWNLGLVLLLQGKFAEGFAECEHRLRLDERRIVPLHAANQTWDGGELHEKRIVLYTDQAMGDAINLIRYAPMVKACGGRVIIISPTPLVRLFEGVEGVEQVAALKLPAPDFDLHCPMQSLPHRFNTTLDTIPANIPYIRANADLSAKWRERLAGEKRLKVGLAWAGGPTPIGRKITLEMLAPLAQIPGVAFFSLQKGEAANEAAIPPQGMEITDWTPELYDFYETAALIANMDVIISVDTAVAHLAGAMGKPTWLLLKFVPDWRWMLNRTDSPWYPSMRLFRQQTLGEWDPPIQQLAAALRDLITPATPAPAKPKPPRRPAAKPVASKPPIVEPKTIKPVAKTTTARKKKIPAAEPPAPPPPPPPVIAADPPAPPKKRRGRPPKKSTPPPPDPSGNDAP